MGSSGGGMRGEEGEGEQQPTPPAPLVPYCLNAPGRLLRTQYSMSVVVQRSLSAAGHTSQHRSEVTSEVWAQGTESECRYAAVVHIY